MLLTADIWDTAGQDRFNSLHPSYYYRAHACLMVFDVIRKVTYKNLDRQVVGRRQLLRCKVGGCIFRRSFFLVLTVQTASKELLLCSSGSTVCLVSVSQHSFI